VARDLNDRHGPEYWDNDDLRFWDNISADFGMRFDETAARRFSAGWLEAGYTDVERGRNRDKFIDYAIEWGYYSSEADFDWAEFRAFMGYSRM
jgi:hypothetical protein